MKVLELSVFTLLVITNHVQSLPYQGTLGEDCIVTQFTDIPSSLAKCDSVVLDNVLIPGGETLRLALRDGTKVTFRGNTTFEYAEWEGPLVVINGTNVVIEGEEDSMLDGQGQLYWDGQGEWGSLKPKFFTIQLHDSIMRNIYVLNSPVHCVNLVDSSNVEISGWAIDNFAGDVNVAGVNFAGHNTDGFDLYNDTNIVLKNTVVYNQDDCIALRCGANILVDHFYCHGGHGLSISVGFSNDSYFENALYNVTIQNSILQGGENGIHLKTHVDGGKGLIQNITYRNIEFSGPSKYGINIQENYRNLPANSTMPSDPDNNIPIRDFHLENIAGTVGPSAIPIYILCAEDGCFDWTFKNVDVKGDQDNSCNYAPENFSC